MWKNGNNTSGFLVTYSAYSQSEGWPDETHMFGTTDGDLNQIEEISLDSDLSELLICVDGY